MAAGTDGDEPPAEEPPFEDPGSGSGQIFN
jgi:hypothetical protein